MKTNSETYIKERQLLWARRQGIDLQGSQGKRGFPSYTLSGEKNLFEPLSPDAEHQFQGGDGKELGNGKTPGRIQAVHSSSALACNMFHYWQSLKEYAPIAEACQIPSINIEDLEFEAKLPISNDVDRSKFKKDPNIDVLISYSKGKYKATGIECKFGEAYSNYGHDGLKSVYIQFNELWDDIPNIFSLAKSISPDDLLFRYLHVAQLIKHILGLKHAFGKDRFCLLYVWYDIPFDDGYHHRHEIEQFAEVVKRDDINFQAITYQEVILNLGHDYYQSHRKYVDYMVERYL
jgi:hypothetical protein